MYVYIHTYIFLQTFCFRNQINVQTAFAVLHVHTFLPRSFPS